MELYVLFGMQLAIGAGFAAFYLKQDARVRVLERRVSALARRVEPHRADLYPVAAPAIESLRAADGGVHVTLSQQATPAVVEPRSSAEAPLADRAWPIRPPAEQTEDFEEGPVERVLRLAAAGQSAGEIARATGRGRGEIELLLRLHEAERPAAPARSSGSRVTRLGKGVEDVKQDLGEKGRLASLERRPARRAARAS